MTPALLGVLIALSSLMCAALVAAGGALWRLGTKVGVFESTAQHAAAAASEAVAKAEAACRASDESAKAWNRDVLAAIRELDERVQETHRKMTLAEARWREVHAVVSRVNDHESRLAVVEALCDRHMPAQLSQRHVVGGNEGEEK